MSQDQKPSKMRLVSSGTTNAGATGGDVAGAGPSAPDGVSPDVPLSPARTGLPPLILALLFVLGCALGGAALPLLHIL